MERCHKDQERISALIDDVLSERERQALMEHMEACPACRQYLTDQMAIHEALTSLEAPAPAGFTEAVMAQVRETKQELPAPERGHIAAPRWHRWVAVAACCAVAALGIFSLRDGRPETDTGVYGMARVAVETDSGTALEEPFQPSAALASEETPALLADADAPAVNAAQQESAYSGEIAVCRTLTTSSALARQWLENLTPDTAVSPQGYTLTEEQFDQLCQLLEEAGDGYTLTDAAGESGWYLILTR